MGDSVTEKRQCFEWTNNVEMIEKICAFLFPDKKSQKEELEDRIRIIVKSGREIIQFDCDKKRGRLVCIYIGNPQRQDARIAAILNGCRKLELLTGDEDRCKKRAIICADGCTDIGGVLPLVMIMEDLEFHVTI